MTKKSITSDIKSLLKLKTTLVIISCFLLIWSTFIFDMPVKIIGNSSASPPTILSFNSSSYTVYPGHYVYLYVIATDEEDSEEDLQLIVEYDDGTGWSSDYIDNNTIWDPQGWLKIKFQPPGCAKLGDYYFRARAMDTEGNISFNWVYLNEPIEVTSIPLYILVNIKLYETEIYRGETLYVILNASNKVDSEDSLIVRISYNRENTGWVTIPETAATYVGNPINDEGYWLIAFTTDKSTQIGEYKFRGIVENSVGDLSYNGVETYPSPDTAKVKNNLPEADDLRADDTTVERRDTIILYADGTDYEDDPDEIEPFFEWRVRNGTWDTTGFSHKQPPSPGGDTWSITFKPRDDAELGSYDFRVYFEDKDGDKSDYFKEEGLIEVTNVLPEVTSFILLKNEGYRLEELLITTDGTDGEDNESELEPIFEYRNHSGDWMSSREIDSSLLDPTEYRNGHWQITFNPPYNAEIGDYSFRVQFIDNDEGKSEWIYLNNSYTLMNINPEVEIRTTPGEWLSSTIIFTASAQDVEDSQLLWEWDFGDGETSNEEAPSHSYSSGGIYTVIVTVTDEDGGIGTDSITVSIEEVDDTSIFNDTLRFYFLIIFIVFAIITITISIKLFSSLRKQKND